MSLEDFFTHFPHIIGLNSHQLNIEIMNLPEQVV